MRAPPRIRGAVRNFSGDLTQFLRRPQNLHLGVPRGRYRRFAGDERRSGRLHPLTPLPASKSIALCAACTSLCIFDSHVSRRRLSQAITAKIEHLILEEHLSPGDRLPSQQKLANQFGVSAPVIREAIQTLAARGLLDVRHGSGTYVRKPSLDILARTLKLHVRMNHTSIMPLHEVRTVLESELAALAAERASSDDLAALDATLAKQRKYLEDSTITNEADPDFHLQLALAAHNDIFLVLLNPLIELIREYRSVAIQYRTVNQASLEDHEAIYQAVRDGDSERARRAMSTHLSITTRR